MLSNIEVAQSAQNLWASAGVGREKAGCREKKLTKKYINQNKIIKSFQIVIVL